MAFLDEKIIGIINCYLINLGDTFLEYFLDIKKVNDTNDLVKKKMFATHIFSNPLITPKLKEGLNELSAD